MSVVRVLVIGAGIGGLATAVGLHRAGADVRVVERAPEVRVGGAALSLFGNAFTALDALGLGDEVRARAGVGMHALQAGQRRPNGAWLSRTPPAAVTRLGVVARAELHSALLGALPDDVLQYGVTLEAVSEDGRSARLRRGASVVTERADLVVAADGIRSQVRASWPGDPGIRYSGYAAWRGITERSVDLLGAAGETWGRGLRFGLAPLRDGRVYWFAVASMPAGTVLADEYAEVRRLFAGWHEPIPAVLAATDAAAVARTEISDLARPLPSFRRGQCVLLGDAAHAMTPDLGQGGGQALEDAATLARLCSPFAADADPAGLESALTSYDVLRRPRTQRLARQARAVGAGAQARGPVAAGLRDALVRLTPPSVAGRRLLAIQAWEPPVA